MRGTGCGEIKEEGEQKLVTFGGEGKSDLRKSLSGRSPHDCTL
jgi:hypothetical protein